jgi:hypothetical protein
MTMHHPWATTAGRAAGALLALLAATLVGLPTTDAAASAAGGTAGCHLVPGRQIVVETVPQVAGFVFEVDGRRYRTGSDGRVQIVPVSCVDYGAALSAVTRSVKQGADESLVFDSWSGAELLAKPRADGTVYAAFRRRALVRFDLVDLAGTPVPRSEVGAIVLRATTGEVVRVPQGRSTVVVDATRIVGFANRVVSRGVQWSVQRVGIDGNTAVTRGGVRFRPRRTPVVTVPLMLYRLRVVVRDAILGRPVGSTVAVVTPNGSTRTVRLGPEATGELPGLSRGSYVLRAEGGSIAISLDQPVGVSRPQEAVLTVVSYTDLAIVGTVVIAVAVGLLLIGRRLRRRVPTAGRPAPAAAGPDGPDGSRGTDAPRTRPDARAAASSGPRQDRTGARP